MNILTHLLERQRLSHRRCSRRASRCARPTLEALEERLAPAGDRLKGFGGSDLIIGGQGGDRLNGSAPGSRNKRGDILIEGRTVFENDPAALTRFLQSFVASGFTGELTDLVDSVIDLGAGP